MSDSRRPASEDGEPRGYRVNVLDRAIAVLKTFTLAEPSLTLSEIAQRADLHVSTCLRLLSTLRHHGLVSRSEEDGRYRLGYEVLAIAEIARSGSGLVDWAMPVMRELADQFDETVVISARVGDYRIDLDQIIGQQSVRRVIALGERKPLYAGAASRVLLSGFTDAQLDAYLERVTLRKLADQTITDPDTLRRVIADVRRDGYAESVQEQSDAGGAGVSAAIFGARNEIVGVIGVSVPQFRFTPSLRAQLIPAVLSGAARISRVIGGTGRKTA
ncbi:transcriptional regulator, IclR family [Devosia enhydra]|uniref:Transcriptional regulator, IclR family n=1 Tax=Devosia enhydra TaxID=665118 RepID=A0A1K2HV39_9HYPH|nr:IclR family transcriptional regulator [Devosia enhydra]SFZ82502.1 transcriptional regulator, IclR family [Devosia enhydra]